MGRASLRVWYLVHKWTSLVCTLFLLALCVSGLPLIFHAELEDALGYNAPLEAVKPGVTPPGLDRIVSQVLAARPGEVVQYLSFDSERPVMLVGTARTVTAPPGELHNQPVDLRTGRFLKPAPANKGVIWFFEELHERLFLGVGGTLFLGVMGLLFVVAVVSGVVLYAPFMRKLDFGTVRRKSVRVKWLDLHNLLGVAVTAWLLVVGATGVFNTLDLPLAMWWKQGQLAEMTAPYRNAPPLRRLGSVDAALAAAMAASPGMKPSTISYPGSFFSTPHHYNVFLLGASPVTSRLLKPALVDAETGQLTDTRDMPLLIRTLFLSRPLHFGDYGGLPLKLVWAGLDLIAIAVLISGLVLWLGRRRASLDKRIEELETGAVKEAAV